LLTSAKLRPSNESSAGWGGGSWPSLLRVQRSNKLPCRVTDLAYAALHCSSRRALAVSISVEETKREPTAPVDMEGIDSSIKVFYYIIRRGNLP
jgi:hypothetical protein